MSNNFYINNLGCVPFNTDNVPDSSYVTGSGSKRPIGLTLVEMTELYWTVKSYKVDISVIDLNSDPFTQFLLAGGSSGSIIGSLNGIAAANQSLTQSPTGSLSGRTKIFNAYRRKNRVCKTSKNDDGFLYDCYGNIIDTKDCTNLNISKTFIAADKDADEARLCVAGPIHSLASSNGQGYVQINFTDIIYSNGLYWPIIIILLGNGESILTSDISSLGANQNNYNIGGIIFGSYGVITLSGYSTRSLQPVFYSVQGAIKIGERCCDRFYFDGIDRNDPNDECYIQCKGSNLYKNLPNGQDAPAFVAGGGGGGGSW